MATLIQLTADDKERLRQIISILGLSQQKAGSLAGVSQSFISRLGAPDGEGFDEEKLNDLLEALKQALIEQEGSETIEPKRLKNEISFLSFVNRQREHRPITFDPGDFVPVDSPLYVSRPVEKSLVESALEKEKEKFSALIQGPVQTGITSMLRQLEANAKKIGVQTLWFDAKMPYVEVGQSANADDILLSALRLLSEQMQTEWALEPWSLKTDTISRFNNWFKSVTSTTRNRPRLLILDDIDSLGALTSVRFVGEIVRPIHNLQGQGYAISIAVGRNYPFGSDFGGSLNLMSSKVGWDYNIALNWFDAAECQLFCERHHAPETYQSLFRFLGGQPYLTHLTLQEAQTDIRELIAKWFEAAEPHQAKYEKQIFEKMFDDQRERAYKRHLKAIKESISGPLSDRRVSEHLVKSFYSAVKWGESVDYDEELFLVKAKMLNLATNPSVTEALRPGIPFYKCLLNYLAEEFGLDSFKK